MKIFNHDIQTSTHEAIGGTHLYSGRVLGLSAPEDIVQMHPALKPEWELICAHYARIGLNHSHQVLWNLSVERLGQYPDYEPSIYLFGDAVHENSAHAQTYRALDERWFNVVEFINSKNNFIWLARALGMAVPKTSCFSSCTTPQILENCSYPCYLKPSVSDSGFGIVRCSGPMQLHDALHHVEEQVPFQVQEEVPTTTFVNLQYQITENGVEHLLASEQILEGCVHGGNRYPTVHQPWALFDPMAEWMANRGMKGLFAFDAAVVEGAEHKQYLAIECNPRFNGSSYPTLIARKLNIPQWSSETFATSCRSLTELDLRGLEFDPEVGTGIILINWGTLLVGKISVLLAGRTLQQTQLRHRLQARLVNSSCESIPQYHDFSSKEPARI